VSLLVNVSAEHVEAIKEIAKSRLHNVFVPADVPHPQPMSKSISKCGKTKRLYRM